MSAGNGRVPTLALILLPYLILAAIRFVLAWPLDSPLKGDELVYLGNARYLATGSGLVDSAGRHAYKVGYSLLLTPAFLVRDDPVGGFKAAQVVNAFLMALIYPATFVLAGKLWPASPGRDRLLLGLCVSCYPAALLYSTTAMSANAFIPAFFAFVLAALSALARPRWWTWALFAAAAVYLYAIHERAIGILLLAVLAAAVELVTGRRPPGRRLAVLGFVVALPLSLALLRWVEVPGSRWDTGSRSLSVVKSALADPETLAVTSGGQLWYLGLATFGMLFAGAFFLVFERRRTALFAEVPRLFWPLLFGSAASVFVISVLFNVGRWQVPRLTHWIYGRQNEAVLLPVLAVVLLALRSAERRTARRSWVLSSAAAAALLAALAGLVWLFWTPQVGPPYSFGASSTPIYVKLLERLGAWPAVALLATGFGGLCAAFAWRWRAGMVALTSCFVLSTAVTYGDSWVRRYQEIAEQRELVRLVRRIEEVRAPASRTLLYDRQARVFHFHYYNASYFLPDYEFRPLRPRREEPAGELVLSGRLGFGRSHPGARLAGVENFSARRTGYKQFLWVLPGALQDALAARGWLLPEDFPGRLPRRALRAKLALAEPPPAALRIPVGGDLPVAIEVEHRGDAPWLHRRGLGTPRRSVRLSVRWYAAGAREVRARQWRDLPKAVYPGEAITMRPVLRPRTADGPLPAGRYRVAVAVAQDVGRRPVVGPGKLELAVEVVEGGEVIEYSRAP